MSAGALQGYGCTQEMKNNHRLEDTDDGEVLFFIRP